MSSVTGLVLMCSLIDGDGEGRQNIVGLDDWLAQRGFRPLVDVSISSGGTKHPQCVTFHCGYNSFPEDEFAQHVLSAKWADPENVVLIMQPEDGSTRVFRPA